MTVLDQIGTDPASAAASYETNAGAENKSAKAVDIWACSKPVYPGKSVALYLESRGIDTNDLPDNVRSLPRNNSEFGALVAAALDEHGNATMVHRVYLEPETGKRPNPLSKVGTANGKRTNGPTKGNPIRFPAKPGIVGPLVLCEGVEDAFSIRQATGFETWACLGSGFIQHAPVPKDGAVVIARDRDEPGSEAEQNIGRAIHKFRRQGTIVDLATPPQGYKDANELLMAGGNAAVWQYIDSRETAPDIPFTANERNESKPAEVTYTKLAFESAFPFNEEEIPVRQYVLEYVLARGEVIQVAGHGASAKSLLTIDWGLAVASGQKFACWEPAKTRPDDGGPLRVVMCNQEDDIIEIRRRIAAALQSGVFAADTAARIADRFTIIKTDFLKLVEAKDGVAARTETYGQLMAELRQRKPDLIIFDPLVELTVGIDENSATMQELHAACRQMGRDLNAAVVLVHHFAKSGTASNQNAARGSSTLPNGARTVLNVERMNDEDARTYNLDDSLRHSLIKTFVAKSNYCPVGATQWFQLVSKGLRNGEQSPALVPWEPPQPQTNPAQMEWLQEFFDEIERGDGKSEYYTNASKGPKGEMHVTTLLVQNRFLGPSRPKDVQAFIKQCVSDGALEYEPFRSKRAKAVVEVLRVKNRTVYDKQPKMNLSHHTNDEED
jgi:hypothetical protein